VPFPADAPVTPTVERVGARGLPAEHNARHNGAAA
jgi:hypothetical protein